MVIPLTGMGTFYSVKVHVDIYNTIHWLHTNVNLKIGLI